jgi:hypothetical protein
MGWTNSHLHGFRMGGQFYSEPNPDYANMAVLDERRLGWIMIATEVGAHFVYEYDFGDSWDTPWSWSRSSRQTPTLPIRAVIGGKRACPPEDVGGVPGYLGFLAAIHNPRHPEHAEWLQWAGDSFDSEAFDLQKANELLQAFYSYLMENT